MGRRWSGRGEFLFAKCLLTRTLLTRRRTLGFVAMEFLLHDVQLLRVLVDREITDKQQVAFVEVCCSEDFVVRQAF